MERLKKIPDHAKYITTSEFNKFFGEKIDAKLTQVKIATNKDVANVEQRVIAKKIKQKKKKTKTKKENYKHLI